ncbi:MAG: hypothetical protein ACOZAL_02655 [Patescibacteria group bacterium]
MVDINLIPREYREKKEGFKIIFSKATLIILTLIILSLLFYGGLLLYQKNLKNDWNNIKEEIRTLNSKRNPKIEKSMIDLDKKISDLKTLFENHLYWSSLFKKIEELTIPEVYFSQAKFNLSGVALELNLEGNTSTYTNLARQILSFQEDSFVKRTQVSGISLDEKTGLKFNLSITFSREILLENK